jgi:hypothetical protein
MNDRADDAARDEAFRAWLSGNDHLLDEFVSADLPDLPAEAFTEAGLRSAENAALDRFADPDEALSEANRELYDKFVRFIGETFVRSLGGRWTNKPLLDDGSAYLGVLFPWSAEPLTIPTLFTSALARRTGQQWAFVHRNMREDRDNAGADRPPPTRPARVSGPASTWSAR